MNGIPWKVPAIKSEAFTVEAFKKVIGHAGKDLGWVWVDIACIDQGNLEAKMEEVGRQADIFRYAWSAYVWFHGTNSLSETNYLHALLGCS